VLTSEGKRIVGNWLRRVGGVARHANDNENGDSNPATANPESRGAVS
jgi:hypothetical protein